MTKATDDAQLTDAIAALGRLTIAAIEAADADTLTKLHSLLSRWHGLTQMQIVIRGSVLG
jgi:hypothetical protein